MMAANEAVHEGYGGVSRISRICGLSRDTISKGIRELGEKPIAAGRIRRPGGGRHPLRVRDPELPHALETLVEPLARGDPQSPLRWTCKSTRTLAAELARQDHPVSHEKVAQLLRALDYSLQGNRKTEEGADHPDRDAQFQHINDQVRRALAAAPTGHLRGHEEEGIDRELRERGPAMAPQQGAGPRATATTFRRPRCPGPIPTASTIWPATRGS